uniref:ADP-ribosylation factor n=1 Tax=Marmota marmota marmota TaxID=9994 RepID=A0A8C5Z709_MARMA
MGNGLSDQTSILSSLPSFQSFHIVILGLDCAGKTTVLYRLQFNEFVNTVPTKGFNTEKIKHAKTHGTLHLDTPHSTACVLKA